MNKEQEELLNEVYGNYWGKVSVNNEEDCLVKQEEGSLLKEVRVLYQQEFINKCKTDTEFSEKWGLTIEERELSLEERVKIFGFEKINTTDTGYYEHSYARFKVDKANIPTKLITVKHNDKTIESYE